MSPAKSARYCRRGFIWKSWRSLERTSVSLKRLRLFLWFSQGQRAGPCPPHRVWREKPGSSWGGHSSVARSSSFLGNSPTKHTLTQLVQTFSHCVCVCSYIVTDPLCSRIILSCEKVLHRSTVTQWVCNSVSWWAQGLDGSDTKSSFGWPGGQHICRSVHTASVTGISRAGMGVEGQKSSFPCLGTRVPPVSLPTAKGLPGHKEHGSADAKGGKRHSSSSLELQRIINNFVIAPAGGKAGRMDFPQNIHTQQSDVRHGAASFYQRNVRKQEV